ncbi:MAG: SulP family inorganic anion transporter, partial [Candidatus Wallbacteria bacterium]|nr:SulP family inorganic anion transporter [Candidatus Wallbacteria bacterium]
MPSNPEERVALPGRIAALAEQYAESWSQMLGAETLWSDVNAGVAVALVALPLSIAIAIASGVHPGAGLTSAILAGAIAALMGGSRVAVTGPAAAVSVVALGVVQTYGLEGLLACGLFTGAVQCMVGLLRWGRWISIVPLPVIVGFTSGIGVLIVDGQLPMALGAVVKRGHEGMYVPFTWLSSHWGSFQAGAATITFVTLATLILARRFNPRLPGHLLGAIAGTFAAETLFPACSRVGDLPRSLAYHGMPHLGLSQLGGLVVPACTIAFLASLESLLSALVADSMTRDRHDPDLELIGQGLANIIAPLFGGIVSTGVIA